MNEIENLVSRLSPTIFLPGRIPLMCAIQRTVELLQVMQPDDISFTKDVYSHVAQQTQTSLSTAERAIYRAVDSCWMNGNNENFNLIIGRQLLDKPAPREFILYCAYYLSFNTPYHNRALSISLPPF